MINQRKDSLLIINPEQVLISWLESGKASDIQALDLDSSDNIR